MVRRVIRKWKNCCLVTLISKGTRSFSRGYEILTRKNVTVYEYVGLSITEKYLPNLESKLKSKLKCIKRILVSET